MESILHVLIIEDNDNDAELLVRLLSKSDFTVSVERVETEAEMAAALENESWDIIISDYALPQFDAPSALKVLKKSGKDIPFIVVSGTIGEETAVEMMKSGAHDYLMKGSLGRLIPAISRELHDAQNRLKRKQAETHLVESETKFRAIFEKSIDAIGISRDGIHSYVNPAYVSLFGYSDQEEVIGRAVLDFIAVDERNRISGYAKQQMRDTKKPVEYETRGLRKDGTEFEMDVRVAAIELNALEHTLFIIRDITLRKMAESELINARKKAEESDLMKSSLMMNMSHEFRTPMNAILGFSSLIRSECMDEIIRDMADRIQLSGERLMKTLDNIMEFTQLQAGIEVKNLVKTELCSDLKEIVRKFEKVAAQKQIFLELKTCEKFAVVIEKVLFDKAISEIINNAIKYTSQGGVSIELDKTAADGIPMVELKISDTGIGIAKEHHDRIFESFQQISIGYSRSYEGSGLGLAIAKKIVELLKGTIKLESEVGRGSVFTITFPVDPLIPRLENNNTSNVLF